MSPGVRALQVCGVGTYKDLCEELRLDLTSDEELFLRFDIDGMHATRRVRHITSRHITSIAVLCASRRRHRAPLRTMPHQSAEAVPRPLSPPSLSRPV